MMQMSAMKTCFQIAECSIFSAKIRNSFGIVAISCIKKYNFFFFFNRNQIKLTSSEKKRV